MTLADALKAATKKRPTSFQAFLDSLSEDDRDAAWAALKNESIPTYTLLRIFRDNDAHFGKDLFVPLRRRILAGELSEKDFA